MTVSPYTLLKQQIEIGVCSSVAHLNIVSNLKELFKRDINSPRRYEQIKSIGQLLTVLEIRDLLSEDNVQPLKDIAQRLADSPNLLRKITDYEASHVAREYVSYYGGTQNVPSVQAVPNINTNVYGSNMSAGKKQRINETIQEEIGTFWKDLGRNLKVRECSIDEINTNPLLDTIEKKTCKVLEIYEKKADPQRWFLNLCDALEKSRRTDLSKSLQEIMTMNI